MTATYNVVIAGKTGTGKSSLINYLYGDKVVETGVGKPVTQRGFNAIDYKINGLNVKLFDSWGLEVGKDEEWMRLLNEELERRGTDKPVEEWFHSVFYCIGASGHRMEDFDTKIIKRFMDSNYNVIVILTKADTISEAEEKKLKAAIQKDLGAKTQKNLEKPISIIPVCAEEKILRGGSKSEPFGKKEIELQAYNDFWNSIVLRLPERCVKVLGQRIDEWHEWEKKYIDHVTGAWNNEKIKGDLKAHCQSFIDTEFKEQSAIKKELEETLKLYGNFAESLNYPPPEVTIQIGLPKEGSFYNWLMKLNKVELILSFISISLLSLRPISILVTKNMNKVMLFQYTNDFVNDLKKRLPTVESEIKKSLIKMKEQASTA